MGEPRQSDVVSFRAALERLSKSSVLFQNASEVLDTDRSTSVDCSHSGAFEGMTHSSSRDPTWREKRSSGLPSRSSSWHNANGQPTSTALRPKPG